MLNMKKHEQELLFFLIGERESTYYFPLLSRHYKRRIDRMVIIYDLKNVSMLKTYYKLLPILKMGNHIFKNFFPGTLHKMIVVNSGGRSRKYCCVFGQC